MGAPEITPDEWKQDVCGVLREYYRDRGDSLPTNETIRATPAKRIHGLTLKGAWGGTHVNAIRILLRLREQQYRILATPHITVDAYWIGPVFHSYDTALVAWKLL